MSEKRKYRQFTPEQKTEIVRAGLRGDRSVRDVCRKSPKVELTRFRGHLTCWEDVHYAEGEAAVSAGVA